MMKETTPLKNEKGEWWGIEYSLNASLSLLMLAGVMATLLMLVVLIMKLLGNVYGEHAYGVQDASATENSQLLPPNKETEYSWNGTSADDIESGKWHCETTSSDLYDGSICVICYDDQKSCFFIPCGHFVTCCTCADRIISQEIKTCPICRTLIIKVNTYRTS